MGILDNIFKRPYPVFPNQEPDESDEINIPIFITTPSAKSSTAFYQSIPSFDEHNVLIILLACTIAVLIFTLSVLLYWFRCRHRCCRQQNQQIPTVSAVVSGSTCEIGMEPLPSSSTTTTRTTSSRGSEILWNAASYNKKEKSGWYIFSIIF